MSKFLKYVGIIAIAVQTCLCACTDKDDVIDGSNNSIIGTWRGTHSYYNPVGGTKFQYLTLEFNSDGTGKLEYESPTTYSIGYFRYKLSAAKVECNGVWASSSGDYSTDFTITLLRQGDRLLPQGQYNVFILTKGGMIETNGDGQEVTDDTGELLYYWVLSNGASAIRFFANGNYTEFTLEAPFSNKYISRTEGTYTYDWRRRLLKLNNTTEFAVVTFTENSLVLNGNGKQYSYTKASDNYSPDPTTDLTKVLETTPLWWSSKYSFSFCFQNGNVRYLETSSKVIGSYGRPSLDARGTYSVSGKQVTCRFTSVDWEYSSSYPNLFPGWTAGQVCTKTYTAELLYGGTLMIKMPEGNTVYLSPL